ncbi:MAG: ATP-binding cassette domain-containing protein, partial [Anaerolineae bacterium]|nr:ATP-binding cassette domain-containing protein [Anaerolineae bacterium]
MAWQQAAPLFHAAARPELVGIPAFVPATGPGPDHSKDAQPVLDAQDLIFHYDNHAAPVLRRCSLRICQGDRLLLEGPSGSGKSTLVSLLTGLRTPES